MTPETMDSIFDSSYKQRVRGMQSEKASVDILELGTEMDIKSTLVEWYTHVFHRLVQRKCCGV